MKKTPCILYIWYTCYVSDLSIPKLENPPVQNGNKKEEGPADEVDEEACRRPDWLPQNHSSSGWERGIKVFHIEPEQTCSAMCMDKLSKAEKNSHERKL